MLKIRTVALISVAFVLVAVLSTAAYFKITPPVPPAPVPNANPVVENFDLAPVSANPIAAKSVYNSEQSLRNWLDDAYEKHQTALVQKYLRILNGRYERRCCGLPY